MSVHLNVVTLLDSQYDSSTKLLLTAGYISLFVPKLISSKLVFLCPWECLCMGKFFIGRSVLAMIPARWEGREEMCMHKSNY